MQESDNGKVRILDCAAADNAYLHRDFHGALCYAIKYLDETYGAEFADEYLREVGRRVFAPLHEALAEEGLGAVEAHFRGVFALEGGEAEFSRDGDEELTIAVSRCPAVEHLKARGLFFTERFCATTGEINAGFCEGTEYVCTCEYEPGAGRCVQRFWKEEI
jgi:predicted ArsR family transcriptional regulator